MRGLRLDPASGRVLLAAAQGPSCFQGRLAVAVAAVAFALLGDCEDGPRPTVLNRFRRPQAGLGFLPCTTVGRTDSTSRCSSRCSARLGRCPRTSALCPRPCDCACPPALSRRRSGRLTSSSATRRCESRCCFLMTAARVASYRKSMRSAFTSPAGLLPTDSRSCGAAPPPC